MRLQANATGVYGGYRAGTGGGPGGPPGSSSGSGNTSLIHTETFLRGGYFTNDNGIVEITTIYPGYYTGRTAHIHTMIHKDWKQASNGTLISAAGSLLHIGQFFFDETWNNEIFATAPYNTTDQQRTLNSEDSILDQENSDGNNAFVKSASLLMSGGEDVRLFSFPSLQELGSSLDGGLLGYISA
ncbi:hypothetical protein H0H93_002023 [Arthromyces matolae]|nr:hypothetical protein H0H93_002023 [Arthromyces matolae]